MNNDKILIIICTLINICCLCFIPFINKQEYDNQLLLQQRFYEIELEKKQHIFNLELEKKQLQKKIVIKIVKDDSKGDDSNNDDCKEVQIN